MRRFLGSSEMDMRDINRLETPSTVGFRSGMSSCTVIGHKLGTMYRVPVERSDRIDAMVKAIDRTVRGR